MNVSKYTPHVLPEAHSLSVTKQNTRCINMMCISNERKPSRNFKREIMTRCLAACYDRHFRNLKHIIIGTSCALPVGLLDGLWIRSKNTSERSKRFTTVFDNLQSAGSYSVCFHLIELAVFTFDDICCDKGDPYVCWYDIYAKSLYFFSFLSERLGSPRALCWPSF